MTHDYSSAWRCLFADAENDVANALHERRGWLHRLFWRSIVRSLGYCVDCAPTALAVVEAARNPDGSIRSAANSLRNDLS